MRLAHGRLALENVCDRIGPRQWRNVASVFRTARRCFAKQIAAVHLRIDDDRDGYTLFAEAGAEAQLLERAECGHNRGRGAHPCTTTLRGVGETQRLAEYPST